MEIKELIRGANIEQDKKLPAYYDIFENLIQELRTKEIHLELINTINQAIEALNIFTGSNKDLLKLLRKKQSEILQLLEKELKLVTKNHYMTLWMSIGMPAFGIPMGVVFGFSLGSMAYIGLGLPLGMLIGMVFGISLDKKAYNEGKQLQVEISI
ncbi:hypothetical protein ACXR6G_17860 [Ancylomarina sp. YFZ004]